MIKLHQIADKLAHKYAQYSDSNAGHKPDEQVQVFIIGEDNSRANVGYWTWADFMKLGRSLSMTPGVSSVMAVHNDPPDAPSSWVRGDHLAAG